MSITVDYNVATPLCRIMGEYGSDKGTINITKSWHNYTTVYYSLFNDIKDKPLRIFELGLGTNNVTIPSNMGANGRPGASLRGWATFFPNATVYGADIDRDILFKENRINTYYCDQLNPKSIEELWANAELREPIDIIIEDGLHTYAANKCFFENSIHKLKQGGYYITEDILTATAGYLLKDIEHWKKKYPHLTFEICTLQSTRNHYDNRLMIVHWP
jgi:hypothetical protein